MKLEEPKEKLKSDHQKEPQKAISGQESSQKTPQFLYHKSQILFHYTFYLVALAYIISIMHNYIINHYPQMRSSLKKSYFSDMIESALISHLGISSIESHSQRSIEPLELFQGFKINIYRYCKDPQWQSYRSNLWLLILMALIWRFLTYLFYLIDTFIIQRKKFKNSNHFSYVNGYIFIFSLCILLFSFRADIVFYIAIIMAWWLYVQALLYFRTKIVSFKFLENLSLTWYNNGAIVSLWVIVIVTLYMNQKLNHFRLLSSQFQKIIPDFMDPLKNSNRTIHCSQFLNMTFLRLLSYSMDRIHQNDPKWQEKQNQLRMRKLVSCQDCQTSENLVRYCNKGRDHVIKQTHSLKDYLNYTLYTPLLLTGPPISYNNFFSYNVILSPQVTFKEFIHHVLLIFSFEIYLHMIPVVVPNPSMTLAEMEAFSLFHLVFIWYKFLIIWKTARLWSKIYGVEVIDNMSRCIFNNYGFEGFWRMWHRGFNHWLIRYLYVPLGGRSNILSVLGVVIFVSFWHDHTINIVFWGLIIAMFMIPEIMIKRYFRKYKRHWYNTYWFKYLAGFVSSIYIHFLIICNCIGFGYGVGEMQLVLDKIVNQYQTVIGSIFIVMIPTLCMFHIRNLEGNTKNY